MKVLLFGATGMVGQGVGSSVFSPMSSLCKLLWCYWQKMSSCEIIRRDLYDYSGMEADLTGLQAPVSSVWVFRYKGMKEEDYERITYGITLAAAKTLAQLNPDMTFIYVSGMGTDSTEQGRIMWARVKGKTENALLRLPFKAIWFSPCIHSASAWHQSRTMVYRRTYALSTPLFPVLNAVFPHHRRPPRKLDETINVSMRAIRNRYSKPGDINRAATTK